MVTNKYGKHILREPMGTLSRDGKVVFNGFMGLPQHLNTKLQLLYSVVTKAHVNEATPHIHTFPIVMSFIGADSNNIKDIDAEIEFYLGGEKQVITTTAMVSVPAGLAHCPLIFKRVGKPLIFLECMLTDNYERTEVSLEELQRKLKEES
jgi:hypothetical protein